MLKFLKTYLFSNELILFICFIFIFAYPLLSYCCSLEEEWERELEEELQDYEMVSEQKSTNSKSDNWEQEIEEILQDETDLK